MDVRKIHEKIFLLLVEIVAVIFIVPPLIHKLFGRIWSWEGLVRSQAAWNNKAWIVFCGAIILNLLVLFVVDRFFNLISKIMCKKKIRLNAKLICGKTSFCFFTLGSLDQRIKLVFGKRAISISILKWVVLLAAGALSIALFPRNVPLTARWFEKYNLVAHAGGTSPNGNVYSNSLEAFESNYQQGHRVFEGDLCLTADGILVVEHDWSHWHNKMGLEYTGQPVTYEQFITTKFYGIETPMDLSDLIEFMIAREDMYFMTDFKNCYDEGQVKSGFQQIVQAAQDAKRMDVLKRFIIQNHTNQFKHWVDEVYSFENWLYTVYAIPVYEDRIPENLVAYCEAENIPVITMWHYMPNDEWFELTKPRNLEIFIHTVNEVDYANDWISAGVNGIYTDDIKPEQLLHS